jgi:hypothetical protein
VRAARRAAQRLYRRGNLDLSLAEGASYGGMETIRAQRGKRSQERASSVSPGPGSAEGAADRPAAAGTGEGRNGPCLTRERLASSASAFRMASRCSSLLAIAVWDATLRARPIVRPVARIRASTCRRARRRDGTIDQTITHGDRSLGGPSGPTSSADLDGASRSGVLSKVPVKLRALPSGYGHELAGSGLAQCEGLAGVGRAEPLAAGSP